MAPHHTRYPILPSHRIRTEYARERSVLCSILPGLCHLPPRRRIRLVKFRMAVRWRLWAMAHHEELSTIPSSRPDARPGLPHTPRIQHKPFPPRHYPYHRRHKRQGLRSLRSPPGARGEASASPHHSSPTSTSRTTRPVGP